MLGPGFKNVSYGKRRYYSNRLFTGNNLCYKYQFLFWGFVVVISIN